MQKKKLVLIQSSPYDHEKKPIKKSKLSSLLYYDSAKVNADYYEIIVM